MKLKTADANREEKNCRIKYFRAISDLKVIMSDTAEYRRQVDRIRREGAWIRDQSDQKNRQKIAHLKSKFKDKEEETLHPDLSRYTNLDIIRGNRDVKTEDKSHVDVMKTSSSNNDDKKQQQNNKINNDKKDDITTKKANKEGNTPHTKQNKNKKNQKAKKTKRKKKKKIIIII